MTLLIYITHIINTSFHTGVFPSAFKQVRMTPLLKKPTLNPTLLENYRPVSPSSFHCKNTWMSCVQPSLCLSHTEQPHWQQPVWFQFRSEHLT